MGWIICGPLGRKTLFVRNAEVNQLVLHLLNKREPLVARRTPPTFPSTLNSRLYVEPNPTLGVRFVPPVLLNHRGVMVDVSRYIGPKQRRHMLGDFEVNFVQSNKLKQNLKRK